MTRRFRTILAVTVTILVIAARPTFACDGDLDGNNVVDVDDLLALLGAWGPCPGCVEDINDDDLVNVDDLLTLLGAWGPCPPPGMALIPAGEFLMGDHDGIGWPDELPVHAVYIDSFHMDVVETTNQQYAAFLNDALAQGLIEVGGAGVVYKAGDSEPYCYTAPLSFYSSIVWDGSHFSVTPGKEDHPMLEVTWYGAAAYANWRSAEDGRQPSYDLEIWVCDFSADGYRMPTEAEWEYGARGGEHSPYYTYPWGDTISGSHANYSQSGDPYETGPLPRTTPVGYYDGGQVPPGTDMANGYGLYDMAGNVWEWCNDWMSLEYYASSPYDNPRGPASGTLRVLRGGSWNEDPGSLRCATRGWAPPEEPAPHRGFRLALD